MFEFNDVDLLKARGIVSQLKLPAQFGMDEDLEVPILYDQLENILDEDFHVACGISKAVIIIDSLPFVIKIPFTGRWIREYDSWWDDDDEGRIEFTPFENANEQVSDDYCYDELQNTANAKADGFGSFVPDMQFLMTLECAEHNYDIYVQEKVTPENENRRPINPSRNSMDIAAGYNVDLRWAAYAIDMYGADYFGSFMEWVEANCSDILCDFHDGNFGYDMSGHPIILDVSGFRD